jgi:hypothetical protein
MLSTHRPGRVYGGTLGAFAPGRVGELRSGSFRLDPPHPERLVDVEPTKASLVAGREPSLDRLHRDDLRLVDL